MKGGILLSPKHGVNPSMGVCELCGKDTGELLLLGRIEDDKEAPRFIAHGRCDECRKLGEEYVAILVCTSPCARTGECIWMRRSAFSEVFSCEAASDGLRSGVVECDVDVANWLKQQAGG